MNNVKAGTVNICLYNIANYRSLQLFTGKLSSLGNFSKILKCIEPPSDRPWFTNTNIDMSCAYSKTNKDKRIIRKFIRMAETGHTSKGFYTRPV